MRTIEIKRYIAGGLAAALLGVLTAPATLAQQPAPAAQPQAGAQLTVTGPAGSQVNVDGLGAVTGATVFSGSRVVTPTGVTGTIVLNGTRVTLSESTDAVVSFSGSTLRVDVVCGAAQGAAAPGSTLEIFTQADVNVHATAAGVRVSGDGRNVELASDEQVSLAGSSRLVIPGGASAEFSSVNCSCMCAQPAAFPAVPVVAAGGFPGALLAAILAGAAAAVIVPVVIDEDQPEDISPSSF